MKSNISGLPAGRSSRYCIYGHDTPLLQTHYLHSYVSTWLTKSRCIDLTFDEECPCHYSTFRLPKSKGNNLLYKGTNETYRLPHSNANSTTTSIHVMTSPVLELTYLFG